MKKTKRADSPEKGIDYTRYPFQKREKIILLTKGLLLTGITSFVFYRSLFGMIILIPYFLNYLNRERNEYQKKRIRKLNFDFKELMLLIANALSAGYSLENAFYAAYKDFQLLTDDKNSDMCQELEGFLRMLEMNLTIESILLDFAKRSGLEDAKSFAQTVTTAKEHGGNLIKILHKSVDNISKKNQINEEIETMVAAKQLEQKIMSYMPMGIIIYLNVTNPGYLDPLYQNILGILIATFSIALTQAAVIFSEKIIEIEV